MERLRETGADAEAACLICWFRHSAVAQSIYALCTSSRSSCSEPSNCVQKVRAPQATATLCCMHVFLGNRYLE